MKQTGKTKEVLTDVIKQSSDILLFMLCLVVAHFFWKFTVIGDEGTEMVTWFGLNITAPFDWMSERIAYTVYRIIHHFRPTCYYFYPQTIFFTTQGSAITRIVWSCTPIKQGFIWLIIMLFARGKHIHKLWYIPLGWVLFYGFNILRITIITMCTEFHPEWFEVLHTYIFRYLFYGFMFLMWYLWTRFFDSPRNQTAQNLPSEDHQEISEPLSE